jgi:CspA family cold shock protein
MKTGKVKWFDRSKGYGFIMQSNGDPELFVHESQIVSKAIGLQENDEVSFEVTKTPKGYRAMGVVVLKRAPKPTVHLYAAYAQRRD